MFAIHSPLDAILSPKLDALLLARAEVEHLDDSESTIFTTFNDHNGMREISSPSSPYSSDSEDEDFLPIQHPESDEEDASQDCWEDSDVIDLDEIMKALSPVSAGMYGLGPPHMDYELNEMRWQWRTNSPRRSTRAGADARKVGSRQNAAKTVQYAAATVPLLRQETQLTRPLPPPSLPGLSPDEGPASRLSSRRPFSRPSKPASIYVQHSNGSTAASMRSSCHSSPDVAEQCVESLDTNGVVKASERLQDLMLSDEDTGLIFDTVLLDKGWGGRRER